MTRMTVAQKSAGAVPARFGLRALVAGVPAAVWLLTGLHLVLLVAWSVLVPGYRAPDEPYHVDMVRAVAGDAGWPELGERHISQQVLASMLELGYADPDAPLDRTHRALPAVEAADREDRPTFAELGRDLPSDAPNQMTQHPPLHYVVTAVPLTVVTGLVPAAFDWSHDQIVAFMRLVSVVLVAPLPLLAFATTRRLVGRAGPAARTAAVIPLTIPALTHLGATVNNDNLLTLLGGLLAVAAVYVATGDLSRRTAVLAGLVTGAAFLTKGFALAVPLWLGLAYLVAGARARAATAVSSGVLAGGVALALGGWWWVRNLVLHGTLQPAGVEPSAAHAGFAPDTARFWQFFAEKMVLRFWGSFGWDEVRLLPAVGWSAAALALVGVVCAFLLRRRHATSAPDRWWWAALAVLLVPVVAVTGIVAYGAWAWYGTTGELSGIHGRYLFLAVAGVAAVVALGYTALAGRWAPAVPLAVLVAAGGMQLGSAHAVLLHFWGPFRLDLAGSALGAWAWSPWPGWVLLAIGLGIVGLGAAATVFLVRDARRERLPAAPSERRSGRDTSPLARK